MSTDYIKRRIDSGLRYNKKGYKEINSRIGRRFFEVSATQQDDIYAICQVNNLTDRNDIEQVLLDARRSENDLRRVKRMIHARKRMNEAKNRQGKEGGTAHE